jgi:hypothetical protein
MTGSVNIPACRMKLFSQPLIRNSRKSVGRRREVTPTFGDRLRAGFSFLPKYPRPFLTPFEWFSAGVPPARFPADGSEVFLKMNLPCRTVCFPIQ